ncbi:MAG: alpha/beta hydrolase [Deltaproteobacteria bacterium]|nr:alpha/beta hydrolase [Deltaproteobacteria bacterium]
MAWGALAWVACTRSDPELRHGTARDEPLAGVTLRVVDVGARTWPVLLVLHGGPGLDHGYLRPWMDALSERRRLVYVDLRGHGRSSAPPSSEGYSIEAAAEDLHALVLRRHYGQVDVLAHDFGAAVALSLAARHPVAVRKVVLVAPLRDAEQVRAVGARTRETLGEAGQGAIRALSTPQGTLRDPGSLPALVRALGAMWWHRPPSEDTVARLTARTRYRAEADAGFLVAALRWDGRLLAPEVRVPVLVVAGASDRTFLPGECRGLADALPHGRYVALAEAGHLPFVESPGAFRAVVEAFLDPAPRPGRRP